MSAGRFPGGASNWPSHETCSFDKEINEKATLRFWPNRSMLWDWSIEVAHNPKCNLWQLANLIAESFITTKTTRPYENRSRDSTTLCPIVFYQIRSGAEGGYLCYEVFTAFIASYYKSSSTAATGGRTPTKRLLLFVTFQIPRLLALRWTGRGVSAPEDATKTLICPSFCSLYWLREKPISILAGMLYAFSGLVPRM